MTTPDDRLSRLVRAGLMTALIDGLFSSVLSVLAYGSTAPRVFKGVASVLIGDQALSGGAPTALLGVVMHVCVAFFWSAVFLFLVLRAACVWRMLHSRYGVLKVAAVYGPLVWLVMSLVVIPVMLQRAPSITIRWWIQLFGHFPFVGLPIVASSVRPSGRKT